ncbi:MAG: hypothetical protein QOC98_2467, partial [Frankiaceae bacterium]|nr:hypothetical protein [Frankiaceae bacterium]
MATVTATRTARASEPLDTRTCSSGNTEGAMNDDATPTAPAAGVVSRSGSGDRVDPVDPVDLVDAVALLAAGEAAALGGAPGDAEASLRPLV